ncbi:unnamed protein product [Eruca vesicaria subsp. sativa]|uniref:KIB1-4 beta-propeller domain-containing protein n=1 Tax=Eruca vesicaria subsp. sativa TaxID=29727 RepID=A0ABC8LUG1_ERUVS|nr:unnamed protein product [Eruca vesicaria subsp. sativa]
MVGVATGCYPFDLLANRQSFLFDPLSVSLFLLAISILKFRPMAPLKCPVLPLSGRYLGDCHILNSRVYLLKSPNSSPTPKYWLFKLGESKNGKIVLYSLFLGRNFFEYECLYTSRLSLNLLDCQIFVIAQEHMACFSEWIEGFDSIIDWEVPIASMGLHGNNNKFAILGKLSFEGLAMYRSVDECWTELEIKIVPYRQGKASYKGKFYAINRTGRTIVVEPTTLEVTTFQQSRPCDEKIGGRWLLKSADKLLLVEMYIEKRYALDEDKDKIWFEVSKLDEKRNEWHQVEDVDDHVLFLDNDCPFSCLATEIPGFRANSIVFLDTGGTSDLPPDERILVFEFSEHGVRSLIDIPGYIDLFRTPPGWVISNE